MPKTVMEFLKCLTSLFVSICDTARDWTEEEQEMVLDRTVWTFKKAEMSCAGGNLARKFVVAMQRGGSAGEKGIKCLVNAIKMAVIFL